MKPSVLRTHRGFSLGKKGTAHTSPRFRRRWGALRRRLEVVWGEPTRAAHLRLVLARELPFPARRQPSQGPGLAKRCGLQVMEKLRLLRRRFHHVVLRLLLIPLFCLKNRSIYNRFVGAFSLSSKHNSRDVSPKLYA